MLKLKGLVSYGTNFHELYRRAAAYVESILRGGARRRVAGRTTNPFWPSPQYKNSKRLDIAIPPSLLARADEGDRLEADNLGSSVAIACLGPLWVIKRPTDRVSRAAGLHRNRTTLRAAEEPGDWRAYSVMRSPDANSLTRPVHDRTPVVVEKTDIRPRLSGEDAQRF